MLTIDPTKPPYTDEDISAIKPPAPPEAMAHKQLLQGSFWQHIPSFAEIDEATFLDHLWQGKHSATNAEKLETILEGVVSAEFMADMRAGFHKAPMSMRVSPYLLSLINWNDPYNDPIRRQFIPVGSALMPDHPMLTLDSLHEQEDAPTPGLTHRYHDKALFLPLDICPVYCRFCTRSYAVGMNTEAVEKVQLNPDPKRWAKAFKYIASRPELEDIVISGGDTYQLSARNLRLIGETLLTMDNVRRIRFATKGPAVMPMKILTDKDWFESLRFISDLGRKLGKDVMLHTHFNNPNEITWVTQAAMQKLFEHGIFVRNQSVLQRGVNDKKETMQMLVKRLGYLNVHPYYVYLHDLVKGVEDLRTTVQTAMNIERFVRGSTAGFNTPTFVCDAPGGGGKRDVHSAEYYDRENGIAVYTAPSVKPGQSFMYFDPIDTLSPDAQARWHDPVTRQEMINEAEKKAADNLQF
jgi:lysine 2,3-aminomutase